MSSISTKCRERSNRDRKLQWNLARLALGLNWTTFSPAESQYIAGFYGFGSGVALFNASVGPLVYVNTYKCGSNAIRANLRRISIRLTTTKIDPNTNFYSSTAELNTALKPYGDSRKNIKAFTFVRSPFSHFEAGIREYLFRCGRKCGASVSTPVTTDMLIAETLDLLHFRSRSQSDISHAFPMVGALKTFGLNVSFIGKMENFDDDWMQLLQHAEIPYTPFNKTIIKHRSGAMAASGRESFQNLLNQDYSKYTIALCYLLFDDFMCLDYPLPTACANMTWRSMDIADPDDTLLDKIGNSKEAKITMRQRAGALRGRIKRGKVQRVGQVKVA
jgi:hypothetical protein